MALTSRELLYLQDNIKMLENSIKFMSGATAICSDTQVKSLLDTMAREHSSDMQVLAKYISNPNIQ